VKWGIIRTPRPVTRRVVFPKKTEAAVSLRLFSERNAANVPANAFKVGDVV